jgi:hypothetical protein
LTLREEHKPGVFENRVLRRIFGPKFVLRMKNNQETDYDEIPAEFREIF